MDGTARTVGIVVVTALVAGGVGYALAPSDAEAPPPIADTYDDGLFEESPAALDACELRLASAEERLARRAESEPQRLVIDPESVPEETRAVLAQPAITSAIEAEVERRIDERFERRREERRAAWAERRVEARGRLAAIGIDEAAIAQVSPAICEMRENMRGRRGRRDEAAGGGGGSGGGGGAAAGGGGGTGGGDAGTARGRGRGDRGERREASRAVREEVEATLGPDRMAALEEEGGLRALGSAVDCGEGEREGGRRSR